MNIYKNKTGFCFDSVIEFTDILASNQTTLIGAIFASFLLISLIISIPFKPLMTAWTWLLFYLYLAVASGFYLFFKWLAQPEKTQLIGTPTQTNLNHELDDLLEPNPIEVIEVTKTIALLPPAKTVEKRETFKDFVIKNLPEIDSKEIEPESLLEEITVDSNPEISQRITYPSFEFTRFYTLWDLMNTTSNLFKEVKVSELKAYAHELKIPKYRKLKKLELLIAIATN